jgi:sigma-B regulation protein RsbQ
VSAIIGALAAAEEPERFARLVLVGPSPRYIDDVCLLAARLRT